MESLGPVLGVLAAVGLEAILQDHGELHLIAARVEDSEDKAALTSIATTIDGRSPQVQTGNDGQEAKGCFFHIQNRTATSVLPGGDDQVLDSGSGGDAIPVYDLQR